MGDIPGLDEQIEKLRGGGTLSENEVRALCDKVRRIRTSSILVVKLLCDEDTCFSRKSIPT